MRSGFIKFMFPNQHSVYLHDTPNRNLFSAGKRAFSHGCVRVDKPFELAEEILGKDGDWTGEEAARPDRQGRAHVNLHQRCRCTSPISRSRSTKRAS